MPYLNTIFSLIFYVSSCSLCVYVSVFYSLGLTPNMCKSAKMCSSDPSWGQTAAGRWFYFESCGSVKVARHSSQFFLFSCYCGLSCRRRAHNTAGQVEVKSFDAALHFTCSWSVQVLSVAFKEHSLPRVFGIRLVISYSLMQNGSFCWLHSVVALQFICSCYPWILCWNHIGVKYPLPVASCNFLWLLMYSMLRFSGLQVGLLNRSRRNGSILFPHKYLSFTYCFFFFFLHPTYFDVVLNNRVAVVFSLSYCNK